MLAAGSLKTQLDRLLDDAVLDDDEPALKDPVLVDEVKRRFRDAGPGLLERVTADLWSYYRAVADEFTPQQRSDYGIPELPASADIWAQVTMTNPPELTVGCAPDAPGRIYISFEGDVSWEPEHGLQLVVEEGSRVCKLGPYDGHVTNAAAFNDPSLVHVVFQP